MRKRSSIGTSIWHWIGRGFFAGLMLAYAVNALSYFFRSQAYSNLVHPRGSFDELIGFPWVVWHQGNNYRGLFVDYSAMGLNFLVASLVGVVGAFVAVAWRMRLNKMIRQFESQMASQPERKVQFSIRGLMICTALIGILTAAVSQWSGTAEMLWFVYWLGPATLLGLAFLPPNLTWQQRVVIVAACAVIVIAGSIWTAHLRRMQFEQVLLGVFVCWTPQSAFAAAFLMAFLLWRHLPHELQDEQPAAPPLAIDAPNQSVPDKL